MEEAPENSKELLHSAHANGMNECSPGVLQIPSGTFRIIKKTNKTPVFHPITIIFTTLRYIQS